MIIWLASYPRTGSTLLRTVLRQTMSLPSFTDTPASRVEEKGVAGDRSRATAMLSVSDLPADLVADWPRFYRHATESSEVFLVKTHAPPVDDQPYIYVVRDGRLALASHLRFHRSYHPAEGRTLEELLTGADYYGLWCDHARPWLEKRPGVRGMVVRFEELREASPGFLAQLAGFIGVSTPPTPWVNPLESLHAQAPDFFGNGSVEWRRPDFWDDRADALFWMIHGEEMARWGYGQGETPPILPPAECALAWIAVKESRMARRLQWECDRRLEVIRNFEAATAARRGSLLKRASRRIAALHRRVFR